MNRAITDQAKNARRQTILMAALDEFFERGFKAARMDDIARRAGLSKGALYLYFDTKEALFTALIETVAIPAIERIEIIISSASTAKEAISSITSFAPYIIRETPLPRVLKVLLADSGTFPDMVRQYRSGVIERGLGALARLLDEGSKRGELSVEDPALTARLIIAPIVLSAIWHAIFETDNAPRIDLDELFRLHRKMLLSALSLPQGDNS